MITKTNILRAAMVALVLSAAVPMISAVTAQPASGYIVADFNGEYVCIEGGSQECPWN